MADPDNTATSTAGRLISPAAKAALTSLAAPEAVSVMEDMLRLSASNNNNNNTGGGGGSLAGISREQLLQKVSTSLSDDQLHAVLKQQGIV